MNDRKTRQDDTTALKSKSSAATPEKTGPIQLRTILVPVDFSEFGQKAMDYAQAFAQQFQAKVVLLHVVEPMVYPENYVAVPTVSDDINQSLMKAAEERLAVAQTGLGAHGVKCESITRLGRPYFEITEAAKELETDVIILATHGYTGLKHVLMGSTAERVVRHAPCPVLTVRSAEHDFIAQA